MLVSVTERTAFDGLISWIFFLAFVVKVGKKT
jgi:hypothetical protein